MSAAASVPCASTAATARTGGRRRLCFLVEGARASPSGGSGARGPLAVPGSQGGGVAADRQGGEGLSAGGRLGADLLEAVLR